MTAMDETVLVKYSAKRYVYVDDELCAVTNRKFIVETGTHKFDLGEPLTYEPSSVTVQVTDTTPLEPYVIVFEAQL